MKTIVFYVHRTGLLSYFINPICEFLSKDYRIVILHVDKKNGYSYAPKESELYRLYDLSDMNVKGIMKLLGEINPSAVILLGFISIYELLVLRICKHLGLKTIYLEHGIYSKETSTLPFSKLINKFGSTVRKNVFFLKRYIEFIAVSGDIAKEAKLFWRCFKKKEYWGTKFDNGLFFAEYGYKQIDHFFHYDKGDVDYVCYPLSKTNDEFVEYKKIADLPLSDSKEATYIHQPFILDGLAIWSYEEERDWMVGVNENLRKQGYKLSIQVHPRADIMLYRKLYEGTGIRIMQGIEKKNYKDYSLVLGHYSTALLYPIFFRIPIMLIDYPNVSKAEDSTFYPVSCSLPIGNVAALTEKYSAFAKEYMGEGIHSFENIANVVKKYIK